jgi:sulfite reductase (ferredoxin)
MSNESTQSTPPFDPQPRASREKFLPRFSDPKDVDTFVEMLGRFESGQISSEEFRAFRLLRGVYGQRQSDVQMIRVKIPFGRLFPAQLAVLADVAEDFSRGFGHVTTRQNVQFHFVKMADAETLLRRLDAAGLTTREACGNSVRTVTACEVASVCEGAAFDVTAYAEAVTRMLLRHPLSSSLPRKFKIAFSGCDRDCAFGAINDLGFVAKVRDGERGFKVLAAGGLSTTPQAAIVLHEFVRAGEVSRVAETVVRMFHALGNRENKHRARLKYVLRKLGEAGFRAEYARRRAEVDAEALAELVEAPQPATTPATPIVDDAPRAPGYLAWKASAAFTQKQAGYAAVYVRLPLGDVTATQMRALGGLATRFGDGTILLSIDQNLVLPWVDVRSLPAIHRELARLELAELDRGTARDVTSCPGAESCNLAVTGSRSLARGISDALEGEAVHGLRAFTKTTIKISGCPNSCGQHHIADLGFHGAVKSTNGVAVPMYQLHLGGGVDARGARFGRQVVKIIARRVPQAVVALLELFESDGKPGEEPAAFFQRVEAKRVVEALGSLLGPATPGEETDIGETQGFQVAIGAGECAA